MSVATALRSTPKGQLKYSPCLNVVKFNEELNQHSPPPLSRPHQEKEFSKLNLSFGLDPAELQDTPNTPEDNKNFSCNTENSGNNSLDSSPDELQPTRLSPIKDEKSYVSSPPIKFPLSPEFGYTSCAIMEAEKAWESFTKMSMSKRQAEFDHHDRSLKYLMENKTKEIYSRLNQQTNHRQLMIDRKLQEGLEEANKRRQRLKQDHEEHQKKINTKQKEIERKRELLEEEERIRKGKISRLHSLWKDIDQNRQKFVELQDGFRFKSSLPEIIDKYRAVLEKICAGLAAQIQDAENWASPDELVTKCEADRERSMKVVFFLEKLIEDTEQKVKEEEDRQKELEKQKAEAAANVKKQEAALAADTAVQSLAFVLKELEAKSRLLAEVEAKIQPFVDDAKNKTFRFSIQRAVNTPINAISDYSGQHLLDKLKRLREVLLGQTVDFSKSGSNPADILLFSQNLIAKMLVRKGEEQVTSKHDTAFPIGAIVVGLWHEFPIIGELFLAHLLALCPYVLPLYAVRQEGQSSVDYHKCLGYKVSEDGTIEEQDKFLRRMSGIMWLYSSCMVAHLPPGVGAPHPHGVENAWMWLARTMNQEPHPDVTATMIYDMLSVTGSALFKEYRVQFAKLLHLLYKSYLPKLESVSVTNASVGRLKILLDTAMKSAKIPPPEGLLPPDFYFRQHSPV